MEEGFFTSFDEVKLYYRYQRAQQASETMVAIHGHGEHCGRYDKFAGILAQKQLSFASFDLRGHGRSEGERVYVDTFEDFVRDFSAFSEFLEKTFSLEKFLLLGHSNGALVATKWALFYPEKIQALFLSSPFLGAKLPKALTGLNALMSMLHPHHIYQNPVYPPYLTHNLAEVENYKKDRLIQRKITARLLSEMLRAAREIESKESFEFQFPVYILMAGMEKVVDAEKTKLFYGKLRVPDKDLRVFSGMYHEIFNELGQEEVFETLRSFIDRSRQFCRRA